jgi:hypothetical protein
MPDNQDRGSSHARSSEARTQPAASSNPFLGRQTRALETGEIHPVMEIGLKPAACRRQDRKLLTQGEAINPKAAVPA